MSKFKKINNIDVLKFVILSILVILFYGDVTDKEAMLEGFASDTFYLEVFLNLFVFICSIVDSEFFRKNSGVQKTRKFLIIMVTIFTGIVCLLRVCYGLGVLVINEDSRLLEFSVSVLNEQHRINYRLFGIGVLHCCFFVKLVEILELLQTISVYILDLFKKQK